MLAEVTLITQLLSPIMAGLGTAISGVVVAFVIKLIRKASAKLDLEVTEKHEEVVERAIERAVTVVQQTVVDSARKISKGELTKEAALDALKSAKIEAVKRLSKLASEGNKIAGKVATDDDELTSRIEAAVPVVKKKTTVTMRAITPEDLAE